MTGETIVLARTLVVEELVVRVTAETSLRCLVAYSGSSFFFPVDIERPRVRYLRCRLSGIFHGRVEGWAISRLLPWAEGCAPVEI